MLTQTAQFDALSQSEVDSLERLIPKLTGTEKIDTEFILINRLVNIDPQRAMTLSRQMLLRSDQLSYNEGQAMGYHMLGAAYNIQSELDSAIYFLERSVEVSENLNDKLYLGRAINALAGSYIRSYKLAKALPLLHDGIDVARQIRNQNLEMTCLMNLAIVNTYLKELDEAENNLIEALDIALSVNHQMRTGQIYGNLGNIEFDRSNYSVAREYYVKGLEIFEELGFQQMIAIIYIHLGRISGEIESSEVAIQYYDKAINIRKEVGGARGLLSVNRYKAQALFESLQLKECMTLIDEIWSIAEEVNDYFILKDLAQLRYKLEEINGSNEEALAYYKVYDWAKDSVNAKNSKDEVDRLTAKYDYEQIQKELETERQQKEIVELEQEQRGLWIMLLLTLLVSISSLYIVNRSRIRKQLIIQEQEKSLLNQKLDQLTSQITGYEDEIHKLENQISADSDKLDKLMAILKSPRIDASDWATFTYLFDELHPGVYSSLGEFDLTINEQRLIALIMLGLSTKEISTVLGISPKGASKARSRLSNKLRLDDTKLLENFLNQKKQNLAKTAQTDN